jgi:hypothetical protein
MAEIRSSGTWGSALSAEEFTAIRSVGFEPVGQVFGAAVYSAGSTSGYSCPGAQGSSGDGLPPRPATQVSGQGGPGRSARSCKPWTWRGTRPSAG